MLILKRISTNPYETLLITFFTGTGLAALMTPIK
jgi:hypothetical protein